MLPNGRRHTSAGILPRTGGEQRIDFDFDSVSQTINRLTESHSR